MFLGTDGIIIAISLALSIFLGFRYGKKFLVCLILAFYPTQILVNAFATKGLDSPLVHIGVFSLIYIAIVFIIRKSIGSGYGFGGFKRLVSISLLSLSLVLLGLNTLITELPYKALYEFSQKTISLVASTVPYWLIVSIPLVIIFVTRRED